MSYIQHKALTFCLISFSPTAQFYINELYTKLNSQLLPTLAVLLEQPLHENSTVILKALQAWKHFVVLSRWIGNKCEACFHKASFGRLFYHILGPSSSFIGAKVISKILMSPSSTSISSRFCITAHSVFLEECASLPNFPLEAIPAAYVSLSRRIDSSGE